MGEGDTLINAIIGAVVSVVLSPLQFSPIIGGAVAGYLEGSDSNEGVRVGTLSGLFAAIPFMLFFGVIGTFLLGVGSLTEGPFRMLGHASFVLVIIAFIFILAMIVALSALGGYLGAYLKREDVI